MGSISNFRRRRAPPPFLYRYLSLQGPRKEWVRSSIVDAKFYCPSPAEFNDPFDFWPVLSVEGSDAELEQYYRRANAYRYSGEALERAVAEAIRSPRHDFRRAPRAEEFKSEFRLGLEQQNGILCFSELDDHMLMWSHYADAHRGICLKFAANTDALRSARAVNYRKTRPVVFACKPLSPRVVAHAFYTKSHEWSYEREWRLLSSAGPRAPRLSRIPDLGRALVGIILGARISAEDREDIRNWMRSLPPTVLLYQARHSPKQYKVIISPLDNATIAAPLPQ